MDARRHQRAGVKKIVLTVSLAAVLSALTFLIGFWSDWDSHYETHFFLGLGLFNWTLMIAAAITAVAFGLVLIFLVDYGIGGFRALGSVAGCLATFPVALWIAFTVLNAKNPPYVGP